MALTAGAVGLSCRSSEEKQIPTLSSSEENAAAVVAEPDTEGWAAVHSQFNLTPDKIHYAAFLVASNPEPVRRAIEQHRQRLNEDPAVYLQEENDRQKEEVRTAAGEYLGVRAEEIALTDSTTMGLGLIYNGLRLEPGQEIVTTEHDYYATHESLRLATERSGATMRKIPLYERSATTTEDELVSNIADALTPSTRVLALTWVHSKTGLKLPIGSISDVVAEANAGRAVEDRILLCVDGVHGFGVEDVVMDDLGCDFFIAGCHKWLFGPRGTGIVWGRPEAWAATRPTIPSFMDGSSWNAWARHEAPPGPTTATRMSPGGFKPFEHQWAMAEAFRFHQQIGKARIAERTHALARQLKEGMADMPHVRLHTPMSDALSSGVICFDCDGLSPEAVRDRMRDRNIVATTTPYAVTHARLAPSILNTPEEIETTLQALRELA